MVPSRVEEALKDNAVDETMHERIIKEELLDRVGETSPIP